MKIKLLQLNAWNGVFLERIVDFIKRENFDVVCLQEVSGGKFSRGGTHHTVPEGPLNPSAIGTDCLARLKNELSYQIEFLPTTKLENDSASYYGNATLYKKSLGQEKKEIIWLSEYVEYKDLSEVDWKSVPRTALALKLKQNDTSVWFINTHFAWGPHPHDENYKLEQAKKLFHFVKELKNPYVLAGDFNVVESTQIISMFARAANNVGAIYGITNTLNPKIHKVKQLFPPGLAVDYIFTHPLIHVHDFKVIDDVNLSDHFALAIEFEI